MNEPVNMSNIRITLKSKVLHRDKFDQMGEQFTAGEVKNVKSLKRKGLQTSTPAKRIRMSVQSAASSFSFHSLNASENLSEDMEQDDMLIVSQGSSGYCSQGSMMSDF